MILVAIVRYGKHVLVADFATRLATWTTGCRAEFIRGAGHLFIYDRVEEILRALLQHASRRRTYGP